MRFYAPWEKAFDRVSTPFEQFLHTQTSSGFVLIVMTVLALFFANSLFSDFYTHLLHTRLSITIGGWSIDHTLHHWINDGLMTIFFFLVGLEIKREVLTGELSKFSAALLPIIAAVGGMVIPALIYVAFNLGQESIGGWGIPMATDIAFAITILMLLGSRVPPALVTFLTALAIVDDLGAVSVIAIFYTDTIHLTALLSALALLMLLIGFNLSGIRRPLPYFIVGVFIWLFMLESGVHATVAGVLTAMTIPARPKYAPASLGSQLVAMANQFHKLPLRVDHTLSEPQYALLHNIENRSHHAQAPLHRLEHALHLPVGFLIVPLFALGNAGVAIDFSTLGSVLIQPETLGIMTGLIAGKVIGIAGFSWIAVKLGFAGLPAGADMRQLLGASFLGGIGFTMSIFIADLAFWGNDLLINQAKTGILVASLIAGIAGYLLLRFGGETTHRDAFMP